MKMIDEQIEILPPSTESEESANKAKQLPEPVGYRLLCAVPVIEDKYDSGLIKADVTKGHEEILTTVLFVVKLGPDAYKDPTKFPTGAWCKEGDFVLVRPHSGTRLSIHGKEFRIINDDSVEGTVEDPRGIKRK
jgi:co-chaperonin GroES (HSP10)